MNNLRTLVIPRDRDQILLGMKKRGFGVGLWNGFGGKVNDNETIEQALTRECREEAGINPITYSKVAEIKFYGKHASGDNWHNHVYTFISTDWEGSPSESEEMRPEWFNIGQLPLDKMWEADKIWLPKVLGGKLISGEVHFFVDGRVERLELNEMKELS